MSNNYNVSHSVTADKTKSSRHSLVSAFAVAGVAALVGLSYVPTIRNLIPTPSAKHNQAYPGYWGQLFQHIDNVLTDEKVVQINRDDTFEIHTDFPKRTYTVRVAEIEKDPTNGHFYITTQISYPKADRSGKIEIVHGQDVTELAPKPPKAGLVTKLNKLRLDIARL